MPQPQLDIRIALDLGQDADPQTLNQLTRQLHQDIAKIGVGSVERATGNQVVEGAKGLPLDANTLLVTLSSAGVLVALIQLLQAWVLRTEGRKIKIRVEKEAFEFEYSPTAVSEDELMAFAEKLQRLLKKQKTSRSPSPRPRRVANDR